MGKLKLFGCVLAATFLLAPNPLIPLWPTPIRGSAPARPSTALLQKADEKKGPGGTTIPAGEAFTLHSNILGEDRRVYVALPSSYSRGVQAYPSVGEEHK